MFGSFDSNLEVLESSWNLLGTVLSSGIVESVFFSFYSNGHICEDIEQCISGISVVSVFWGTLVISEFMLLRRQS